MLTRVDELRLEPRHPDRVLLDRVEVGLWEDQVMALDDGSSSELQAELSVGTP